MIARDAMPWEKAAVAVALAGACGSAAWFGIARTNGLASSPADAPATVRRMASEWAMTPPRAVRLWEAPRAQSRGAAWAYEVFAPPTVVLSEGSDARAALSDAAPTKQPPAMDFELLDVRAELFPLQLVGWIGDDAECRGAFVSPHFPGAVLARPGHRFEELGLRLLRIEVAAVGGAEDAGLSLAGRAARATVLIESSGEEITLESHRRKPGAGWVARLRVGAEGRTREVRLGEVIADEDGPWIVLSVHAEPAEVALRRQSAHAESSAVRVLRPPVRNDAAAAAETTVAREEPAAPVVALTKSPPR
jgi:hypothetical protein